MKMNPPLARDREPWYDILLHQVLARLSHAVNLSLLYLRPPAVQALLPSSPPLPPVQVPLNDIPAPTVEIYEDPEPAPGEKISLYDNADPSQAATHILSQNLNASMKSQDTLASPNADFSDNDEENDPIIHSFGPFGANLLPRMASFNTASSPLQKASPRNSKAIHTDPLQPSRSPGQPLVANSDFDIKEHIINQLALLQIGLNSNIHHPY